MSETTLTKTEIKYIESNLSLSINEISRNLNVPYGKIYRYMKKNQLNKMNNYGADISYFNVDKYKNIKLCGIYYIKNTKNKKFYIGISCNIYNRIKTHITKLSKKQHYNTELQKDYTNNKALFQFGILILGDDIDLLTLLEHNIIVLNKDNIYNKIIKYTDLNLTQYHINQFYKKQTVLNNGCIILNNKNKDGYSEYQFKIKNKKMYILGSRLSYYLTYKVNPGPLLVCHSCHNKACVNPKHLYLGSAYKNANDNHKFHGRPSKFSLKDKEYIINSNKSGVELAKEFNCHPSSISLIKKETRP